MIAHMIKNLQLPKAKKHVSILKASMIVLCHSHLHIVNLKGRFAGTRRRIRCPEPNYLSHLSVLIQLICNVLSTEASVG